MEHEYSTLGIIFCTSLLLLLLSLHDKFMFLTHKMTFDIICTGIHSFILFRLFAFNICQSMHHLDAEQSRVNRGQSASKP